MRSSARKFHAEVVDNPGMTPPDARDELHYAALDGDLARVRELVEHGTPVDVVDDNGWTPLYFAVERGDIEMTKLLISLGASVVHADNAGDTPLHRAVYDGGNRGAVMQLLVAGGADPEARNNRGVTPRDLVQRTADSDAGDDSDANGDVAFRFA